MFGRNKQENGNQGKKRKRRSLSRYMQRLVLIVALVIFLIASLLNVFASRVEIDTMFDLNSRQVVNSIRTVITMMGGFDEYAQEIIQTWEHLPEEVRKEPDSEEYRECFKHFEENEYYKKVIETFENLQNEISAGDLYLAAVSPEDGTIIYLMDPEGMVSYGHFFAGYWKKLSKEQLEGLFLIPDSLGYYNENSPDLGPVRVYGKKIMPDEAEYQIMAMYDFPAVFSSFTAVVFIVIYVIVLSILILVIVLFTRRRIKKRMVRPINAITSAAEQYVKVKKEGGGATSCFRDLDIHTRDELEELSDVMAQMEQDIGVYEQDLTQAAAQQEHIRTELSVATGIQAHMLPDAKTAFQGRTEFSIYASMAPAREVGGDFYDFFLIDDDHLGLVIADVSGKGIPAALFMMSSMIIINNYASMGFSPGEVLERANNRICRSNALDMFVTVWFGILDLNTGEVTAANAGHEYPAILTKDGGFSLLHDKHGLVIGAMEGVRYREYTFTLEKEGALYVYTDGVPEATDAKEELYGTDRMIGALDQVKDQSVEDICTAVRKDIDAFVQDAPQFDDITMLCIRYHGK